jgi:hypothetical protein
MSEKKAPESPFSNNQLEFKQGNARQGSRPAVRPDDKRLHNSAAHLLKGNVPGVNGNIQRKPLAEALRKKIEERAAAEGKTFADFWADLVLKGAEGTSNLTPSQRACIEIIRDTLEGKPGTAKEDDNDLTMVTLDEITPVE